MKNNETPIKVGMAVAYKDTPNIKEGIITRITPIRRMGFTEVGGFIEINGRLTGSAIDQHHFVPYIEKEK